MDVPGYLISAVIGAVIKALFDVATKHDEKVDKEWEARKLVARHMRRLMQGIDGLDTHIRTGMQPSLVHVKLVRAILAEREHMQQHFEKIGDGALEGEVRECYQLADNSLAFAEAYVGRDPAAPLAFNMDPESWEASWREQYARHATHILTLDRLTKELETKKETKPKPRRTYVPPDAMLPPAGRDR